jgi:tricorn protease
MSDALYPAFDRNGKYLYFAASTDMGLSAVGFDMSSNEHPVTRSAYVVVLDKDLPSPLAPESDDEKVDKDKAPADAATSTDEKAKEKPVVVKAKENGP